MKIAFVNDTFLYGRGADTAIYELARRLGKRHDVHIITFQADFPEENFKIKIVPGRKLVTKTWRDFLFLRNLRSINKATEGYDIVNLHHFLLNTALWRKNLVVTYNGSPIYRNTEGGFRKFMREWTVSTNKFLLRFVPWIIAISNSIKQELKESGIRESRIKVIYDGISDEFKPTLKDKNFMLFVGRHEPHKKVDEIIKLSKDLNFKLKIVGDGSITEKLKNYAKRINANKVEFLGLVSRKGLIHLYQECSFFVSASRWEGFGLIFLEAGACGKTSIAYNLFSIPEVIQNNKTGFLVNNYEEFREKAKILMDNNEIREKMGKNAISFSKNFNWNKKAEEYGQLFLKIKLKNEHKFK